MSKPASISIGQSSKSHDPDYASPAAWGRSAGGGWEDFVPYSSPRGGPRSLTGDRWSHAFASLSSSASSTGSSRRASDREPGPAAGCDIQSTPTGQTLDHDDAFALV